MRRQSQRRTDSTPPRHDPRSALGGGGSRKQVRRSGARARRTRAEAVDRDSARERLASRLEAGAEAARAEQAPGSQGAGRAGSSGEHLGHPEGTAGKRRTSRPEGTVQDILRSPVAREVPTAAREIVRGVFGVGRRRR